MAKNNLEIAQEAELLPIADIAAKDLSLSPDDYDLYGKYKAKLTFGALSNDKSASRNPLGKLVLVSAMTPTPFGEGKTTTTIGLTQGLRKLGKRSISATREPALGPIFGIKGGAAGGGYSQVLPMEDINLFFTGDFPAIQAAHNLLSAAIDAHLYHGNASKLDVRRISWPRTVDMNDRALRHATIGLGGVNGGMPREDGFVITPASEVMAILCLSRSIADLKERLGSVIVGERRDRTPVFAKEIGVVGAMAVLLKDAIRPNLVQTIEHGPALVHGGPFGNIAHGCSSVISTEYGLRTADYTITEGGFGSDLGGEKFLNIVAPLLSQGVTGKQGPDAIVCVGTVRAIKHHGDGDVSIGCQNLLRHGRHLNQYGPPVILALNRFYTDTESDLNLIVSECAKEGFNCVVANPFGAGGEGCTDLAVEVAQACDGQSSFKSLHDPDATIEERLQTTVKRIYGGNQVIYSETAKSALRWAEKHGFNRLPVCVAKTQYSLSDDPRLLNAPTAFDLHIQDIRFSLGARFAVAFAGDILLMPGLGKDPAAFHIDIDDSGRISGLF